MSQTDSSLIENLQSLVQSIPFAKGMNLKVGKARKGFVEMCLNPSNQLFNHFKTYQAGVYFTLAEITGGLLCGTFTDLTKNLLITKKSEIEFGHAVDSTLISVAELALSDIERLLGNLETKRKTSVLMDVFIKSLDGKEVAKCQNEYYLRLGIPRSFATNQRAMRSKGV